MTIEKEKFKRIEQIPPTESPYSHAYNLDSKEDAINALNQQSKGLNG